MPIVPIIITLIIIGFVLWIINNYVPMAGSIKTILNALVVIVVLLWLLSLFGIIPSINIGSLKLK